MKIISRMAALVATTAVILGGSTLVALPAHAEEIPGTITITPTSGNASDANFLESIAVSVGAPVGFRELSGTFVYQGGVELDNVSIARHPGMASAAGANGFDGSPIALNRTVISNNRYVSSVRLNEVSGLATGDFELRYYFFASGTKPNRATDPYVSLDLTFNSSTGAWAVKTVDPEPGDITVERIAGADRFATAVGISQGFAPGVDRVYIATGFGYADALSAGAAAAHFESPVLLTQPDVVPASVITELNRLEPAEIIVVGSSASVSAAVFSTLQGLDFDPTVRRIGGTDRFQTSRLIATEAFDTATTAYVATGLNFPDALAASPAAANFDGPVVLVNGGATTADSATILALNELGVDDVRITGSSASVTTGIGTSLTTAGFTVARDAGTDRFLTAITINDFAFSTAETAYFATGFNFPDALAGGARAGVEGAPLFTVQTNCVPQGVLDAIDDLGVTKVVLLGGVPSLGTGVASLTACS